MAQLNITLNQQEILQLLSENFDYPEKPLKYKHIRRISD